MNFARTQSTLTAKVSDPTEGPAARKQLLDYFIEWAPSAFAVTPSDTKILNSPALANMKPHPAKLSVTPGISPPLFDAAIEADYHFWMQLDFPTVFDAMTNYIYQWERIKIPEETIKAGADISKARGKKPTWGEVASLRYKRTGRYAYEDIMRTIGTYSNLIGPPGSEVSLVSLNAAFRLLGTTFSLGIDELTTPRSEKKVPFPDGEGLYIVTCRASQSQRGQGFIRAQSVAWLPVFARAAGQMAEIRLAATITNREEAKKRLAEIQKLLKNKNAPDREALIAEGEALYKTLQSYPESLSQQISVLRERRSQVEKRISEIESGASLNEGEFLFELKNELKRLNNQLEPLEKIEGTRKGRSTAEHDLSQAEQLTAVFVSDLGQTMYLALESVPMNKGTDAFHYYVSDTTTPKSGEADAEGDTKDKAILEAVMKILEGSKGYGRGQISIEIGNNRYNRRVAASEGALLLEAAENMATALSVAAVAAAPFTGGASLYILLPVGVIGAIPSAYRIITSVKDQTFHLDLEFAMDVVNIIGSFVGLGEAAVPLKFLRIGKALLIIGAGTNGLGVLLMGAQIMEQLTNLGDLPPGMKLARILSVVGSAMVQAGIMVGQVLAERAKVKEMERAVSLSEGKQLDAHRQAAFESWESGLSPETKTELAADPSLREFFREMDPRVRRALTLCESLCIPTKPRPSANDIFRIQQLLDRFNVQPDHPGLREYLHRRKFDIGAAIDELWPAKNLTEAKRIFDRSISSLAEGGTAQKVRGKWKFTRNDGKIVTEHTLGEHGKLTTELQSVGFFESHHGIQDVWAKEVGLEVVGYSRDTCYAILLRDSHAGSPHQRITSRQKGREAGRNKRTYEQERQNLRSDMIASDVPQAISDELLAKSDAYFGKLYNALETKMRASGAKTNEINAKMKEIFGSWYPDHP